VIGLSSNSGKYRIEAVSISQTRGVSRFFIDGVKVKDIVCPGPGYPGLANLNDKASMP
jgi:hypothetical protein